MLLSVYRVQAFAWVMCADYLSFCLFQLAQFGVEIFNVPAALPFRLRLDHYRFVINVTFFAALVNCLAISLLFTLSPSLRNVNLCHSQNACQTEWFLLNHTWRAPCIDGGLVTTLVTRKKAEDSISPLFCGRTILTL